MNPFFVGNANPNLSTYKDAESKFKALNVVYIDSVHLYDEEWAINKRINVGNLFIDADCQVPLTLTKMVEMINSGLPIAASISTDGNETCLCFATGTYALRQYFGDYETQIKILGLTFSYPFLRPSTEPGGQQVLEFETIVGMVDFTEEAANGNLEAGTRPGDGSEEYIEGSNVSAFTIAFGMNVAAQKVIPNPFK